MSRTLPTFVHLDADAFFVAVEQALHPELRGKKVAVGGRARGIIASASYEARACGVRTPMPTAQALRICPDLILVSHGDGMSRYSEFSHRLFDLCSQTTPLIERRSIDEGFMDIAPCGFQNTSQIEAAIHALQTRIATEIGISISFGIAANKLLSAIASKQNKPRGFTLVPPGNEAAFLAPLPVNVLPGVGKKTEEILRAEGIRFVRDLHTQTETHLASLLGNSWRNFLQMASGVDDSEISLQHEDAKSYSQQETFLHDIHDFDAVLRVAKTMLDDLLPKVRADGKLARTLTVKVRYPGMEDDTAGRSLTQASDLEAPFYTLVEPLLRQAWRRRSTPARLVMVRLSGIEEPTAQMELFTNENIAAERRRKLAAVVDALNIKTSGTLRHGHGLNTEKHTRRDAPETTRENAFNSPFNHAPEDTHE
jgi:DNA polymerase-4